MTRKGKSRRTKVGYAEGSSWKRAIVVLDENSKIDLF
jgi:ribosomal protein L23